MPEHVGEYYDPRLTLLFVNEHRSGQFIVNIFVYLIYY